MTLSEAQAWVVIIGATAGFLTTTIVTIINTVRTKRIKEIAVETKGLARTIEINTNNRVSEQDKKLAVQDREIKDLKALIATNEATRAHLATETARATAPLP